MAYILKCTVCISMPYFEETNWYHVLLFENCNENTLINRFIWSQNKYFIIHVDIECENKKDRIQKTSQIRYVNKWGINISKSW